MTVKSRPLLNVIAESLSAHKPNADFNLKLGRGTSQRLSGLSTVHPQAVAVVAVVGRQSSSHLSQTLESSPQPCLHAKSSLPRHQFRVLDVIVHCCSASQLQIIPYVAGSRYRYSYEYRVLLYSITVSQIHKIQEFQSRTFAISKNRNNGDIWIY